MSYTYTLSTDVGLVRALIPDNQQTAPIFQDEEITAFLLLEGGVKRATALAIETIATNQALILKVMRLLQLQTDGAKLSDALLKRAALLRKQAEYDETVSGTATFDIAEQVFNVFGAEEKIVKDWQRGL